MQNSNQLQFKQIFSSSIHLPLIGMTLFAFCLIVIGGCSQTTEPHEYSYKTSTLSLDFQENLFLTVSVDSIHVIWNGPKLVEWGEVYVSGEVQLPLLSPGLGQWVQVELYSQDSLRYLGAALFDVEENSIFQQTLVMKPQFKMIHIEIPIGLANPMQIAGGEMKLHDSITAWVESLKLDSYPPYFEMGPIPIMTAYEVEFILWNIAGDTLYHQTDSLTIDSTDMTLMIDELSSLVVPGKLSIKLNDDTQVNSTLTLGMSAKRLGVNLKDVILSELMIQPTSTGSGFEFVEIMNTTLDTLILDSCRLSKSRASSALSSVVYLDSVHLSPGSFLVLGGDSILSKDYSLGTFSLTNTRQDLLLLCQDNLLDSLSYETSIDSLNYWPHAVGKSIQIGPGSWNQGEDPSSWCFAKDLIFLKEINQFFANPYQLGTCL